MPVTDGQKVEKRQYFDRPEPQYKQILNDVRQWELDGSDLLSDILMITWSSTIIRKNTSSRSFMLWTCFKYELLNQKFTVLMKALQEDNLSLTSLFEELFAVFSWEGNCSGDVANELDDVR